MDKDNELPEIKRLDEKQTLFAQKPSAMFYLNVAVRDLLNKMIRWYLYVLDMQPVDMGILDSNMEKLLDEDLFSL